MKQNNGNSSLNKDVGEKVYFQKKGTHFFFLRSHYFTLQQGDVNLKHRFKDEAPWLVSLNRLNLNLFNLFK